MEGKLDRKWQEAAADSCKGKTNTRKLGTCSQRAKSPTNIKQDKQGQRERKKKKWNVIPAQTVAEIRKQFQL